MDFKFHRLNAKLYIFAFAGFKFLEYLDILPTLNNQLNTFYKNKNFCSLIVFKSKKLQL